MVSGLLSDAPLPVRSVLIAPFWCSNAPFRCTFHHYGFIIARKFWFCKSQIDSLQVGFQLCQTENRHKNPKKPCVFNAFGDPAFTHYVGEPMFARFLEFLRKKQPQKNHECFSAALFCLYQLRFSVRATRYCVVKYVHCHFLDIFQSRFMSRSMR